MQTNRELWWGLVVLVLVALVVLVRQSPAEPPGCRVAAFDESMPEDEQALRLLLLDMIAEQQPDPAEYRAAKVLQLKVTHEQWRACVEQAREHAPHGVPFEPAAVRGNGRDKVADE